MGIAARNLLLNVPSFLEQIVFIALLSLFVFAPAFINLHIFIFSGGLLFFELLETVLLLVFYGKELFLRKGAYKEKSTSEKVCKALPLLTKFLCILLFFGAIFYVGGGTLLAPIALIAYFFVRALTALFETANVIFYPGDTVPIANFFYPEIVSKPGSQCIFNTYYLITYIILTVCSSIFFIPVLGGEVAGTIMVTVIIGLMSLVKFIQLLHSMTKDSKIKDDGKYEAPLTRLEQLFRPSKEFKDDNSEIIPQIADENDGNAKHHQQEPTLTDHKSVAL